MEDKKLDLSNIVMGPPNPNKKDWDQMTEEEQHDAMTRDAATLAEVMLCATLPPSLGGPNIGIIEATEKATGKRGFFLAVSKGDSAGVLCQLVSDRNLSRDWEPVKRDKPPRVMHVGRDAKGGLCIHEEKDGEQASPEAVPAMKPRQGKELAS